MMAEQSKRTKAGSWGLLSNYRYLCKKTMMLRAMENTRAQRKQQQRIFRTNLKRKRTDSQADPLDTKILEKISKANHRDYHLQSTCNSETVSKFGLSSNQPSSVTALSDRWEEDSGFSSETSPPASGRSSPSVQMGSTSVVALDCEMVGTGPGGRCSELARCSVVDYHGNVLYDKYVRPSQPVTNYRTRWSGIRKHHMCNATPFAQAREEILCILEGKVVVGHSIYHDFEALDFLHPVHMVRDTISTRLLSRLASLPRKHRTSLKYLSNKLLNRKIQVGRHGHCSVEDARASLDLYKLVEVEWEQELQEKLQDDPQQAPNFAASNHYMQDKYWPDDVRADEQSEYNI